jgi:hypothetical protein
VNALLVVFYYISCKSTAKWETCQIFKVGAPLAGASASKTATSLGESRAAVSKVVTAYTNHRKTSPAERNSDRNPKQRERNRQELKKIESKSH